MKVTIAKSGGTSSVLDSERATAAYGAYDDYLHKDTHKSLREIQRLSVITSYSIHYTKLYDAAQFPNLRWNSSTANSSESSYHVKNVPYIMVI